MGALMYRIQVDIDETDNHNTPSSTRDCSNSVPWTSKAIKGIYCKPSKSLRYLHLCFWLVCLLLYVLTNFMSYWRSSPTWLVATIMSAGKCLFSVCVGGVIIMCTCGHGRWLNSFLSSTPFRFLGQCCFSIYMLAPLIVVAFFGLRNESTKFTEVGSGADFVAVIVTAMISALLMLLLIEMPIQRIVRLFLKETKCNSHLAVHRSSNGYNNNHNNHQSLDHNHQQFYHISQQVESNK